MTQMTRATATLAGLSLAALLLAGCSGGASSTASNQSGGGSGTDAGLVVPPCLSSGAATALVAGARSNSPAPQVSRPVQATLTAAIHAQQMVSIVRLDGNPKIVFGSALTPGANSQLTQVNYSAYVNGLNKVLEGTRQPAATDIRAQAPQADVLGALTIAASEVPRGGNIIVIDSGLQTTTPLDFRTGLLGDDPQTIVSYLRGAGELPDLAGRRVYFERLGWTAPPQPSLGIPGRKRLVAIWEAIARAAGARCTWADETASTNAAVPGRPPVGIVTPPAMTPAPPRPCSQTDLGDADNVGFTFDSATFRDPAGAHATLHRLAAVMLRTGESVQLTGATSSEGSDAHNLALSVQRADAVRAELVQMGVSASRIAATGVGSHLPGRLNDRASDGQLLIGPAIANRKVVARLTGHGCK